MLFIINKCKLTDATFEVKKPKGHEVNSCDSHSHQLKILIVYVCMVYVAVTEAPRG